MPHAMGAHREPHGQDSGVSMPDMSMFTMTLVFLAVVGLLSHWLGGRVERVRSWVREANSPLARWGQALVFVSLSLMAAWPFLTLIGGDRILFHDQTGPMHYMGIAASSLLRGEIPLWTPDLNGGQPVWPLVQVQMPVYDPVTLLVGLPLLVLGVNLHDSYAIVQLIWVAIFALGLYRLGRRLRLRRELALWASLVASLGLLLGGHHQPFFLFHARYAPFLVLAFWHFLRRPSLKAAVHAGVWGGLSTSGVNTPYLVLFLVVLAATLVVARPKVRVDLRTLRFLPALVVTALVGMASLAVVSAQWLWGGHAVSRHYFSSGWAANFAIQWEWASWLPGPWKDARLGQDFAVTLTLAGSSALLLGFAGCCSVPVRGQADRRLRGLLRYWVAVTICLGFFCFGGTEFFVDLNTPVLTMRNWGFLLGYTLMTASLAAAFAFAWLQRRAQDLVDSRACACAAIAIAIVLALCALEALHEEHDVCSIYDLHRSAITVLAAAFVLALFLRAIRTPGAPARRASSVALLLLSAVNLLGMGIRFLPRIGMTLEPGVRARMPAPLRPRSEPQQRRRWTIIPGGWSPFVYEIPTVQNVPTAFLEPTLEKAGPGEYDATAISHIYRTKRYEALLTDAKLPLTTLRGVLGVDLDVVRLVDRGRHVDDLRGAFRALQELGPVGVAREVVLEGADPLPATTGVHEGARRVIWKELTPHRHEVQATTPGPTWLVFGQGYDPWWEAWIDGQPTTIYPANGVAMAVRLDRAGVHRVEFLYRPWPYLVALALRLLFLLGALAWGSFHAWVALRSMRRVA